jgi:tetratricopeptide (TPR) repeat protein
MTKRLPCLLLVILQLIAQQSLLVWPAVVMAGILIPAVPALAQNQNLETIREGVNRGNYYMAHNLFKRAIDEYEKCLDLDPDNSYAKGNIILAHNNWGIYHFHQGEYDLAKKEWEMALRLDPNDRNARNNLAIWQRTMARMGKPTSQPAPQFESDEPPPSLQAKEPPPAAVLLSPNKRAADATQASTQTSLPENDSPSISSGAKLITSQKSASTGTSSRQDSRPTQVSSQAEPLNSYYDIGESSGVKILPKVQPRRQSEAETVGASTLDDTINRLESKIYGQTHKEISVLQRLDKMEVDSFGSVSSGPITDRLSRLKALFNMP